MNSITVRHDGSVKDYLLQKKKKKKKRRKKVFVQCVELEHWTDKIKVYHRERDNNNNT